MAESLPLNPRHPASPARNKPSPCSSAWPARLDEDQADMFTPLDLRLYQHAQDYRFLIWDILDYPSLFGDILG